MVGQEESVAPTSAVLCKKKNRFLWTCIQFPSNWYFLWLRWLICVGSKLSRGRMLASSDLKKFYFLSRLWFRIPRLSHISVPEISISIICSGDNSVSLYLSHSYNISSVRWHIILITTACNQYFIGYDTIWLLSNDNISTSIAQSIHFIIQKWKQRQFVYQRNCGTNAPRLSSSQSKHITEKI